MHHNINCTSFHLILQHQKNEIGVRKSAEVSAYLQFTRHKCDPDNRVKIC